MKAKIALMIVAISVAVVMVVSCLMLCVAVDYTLTNEDKIVIITKEV